MRGHSPLRIKMFKGDFDRGMGEGIPAGYFRDSLNVFFDHEDVWSRYGVEEYLAATLVRRMWTYKRIGEADRIIYCDDSGNIYDSLDPLTPILTIVGMEDFSMVSMFNRAYITPHNRQQGMPGESVYVYQGSGTARLAGGNPPTTAPTVAQSSSSGDIPVGTRLFAVVFETDTGYITKPGEVTEYASTAKRKVDISNIEVGPSGTVARHILVTKTLLAAYSGRPEDYEFFRMPDGKINNNIDTTLSDANFFDTSLLSSADYLWYIYATIPAQLGLADYDSRLIGWGADGSESAILVSNPSDPETISEAWGYVLVDPGTGGGVKACTDYRRMLMAHKSKRSFTITNTGGDPNTWIVTEVDSGIGTEVFGIGQVFDSAGHSNDRYVLADRAGLKLFIGTFIEHDLTHAIENKWNRINFNYFDQIEVSIDADNQYIYVLVPLDDATEPSHVFFADYHKGLNPDDIKWTTWEFPFAPTTALVDIQKDTQKAVFKVGSSDGDIFEMTEDSHLDDSIAIQAYVYFRGLSVNGSYKQFNHYSGVRLRIQGAGSLTMQLRGTDEARTAFLPNIALSAAPGYFGESRALFQAPEARLFMEVAEAGEWFRLSEAILYGKLLWPNNPIA